MRRVILLSIIWGMALNATAQVHPASGSRIQVSSLQVQGMGGAGVAFPMPHTALYYNPALIPYVSVHPAPLLFIGLQMNLSTNLRANRSFYHDRLEPALELGLENLEDDERRQLYADMFHMSRQASVVRSYLPLMSFVLNRGDYGFGGGFFLHGDFTYQVEDVGTDVPWVHMEGVSDIAAMVSGAVRLVKLGLVDVSVGAAAKYTQRFVTVKDATVEDLDDGESVYMYRDGMLAFDLGVIGQVKLPVPGTLYLGATISDLAVGDFDYRFSLYWVRHKTETELNQEVTAIEVAQARQRFQLVQTYRVGVAYVLPVRGGRSETAFAMDYIYTADQADELSWIEHLAIGLQTKIGKQLAIRGGLHQGLLTMGAGLYLGDVIQIDYAYFEREYGPVSGQGSRWHHGLRVSVGNF